MNSTERKLVLLAKKLTTEERKKLPKEDFALGEGHYPIEDESHARNALTRISEFGTPSEKAEVREKVHEKFPDIKMKKKKAQASDMTKSNDPKYHAEKIKHHRAEAKKYKTKAANAVADKTELKHAKEKLKKHTEEAEKHLKAYRRLTKKD